MDGTGPDLAVARLGETTTVAARQTRTMANGSTLTRADRRRHDRCPVCGARLARTTKRSRFQRGCPACRATLQTVLICAFCHTDRVWRGADGAFCHGCGHEHRIDSA